ncbi:Jacalin-like lectin domain - like 1, partial [Theobroma cacao]
HRGYWLPQCVLAAKRITTLRLYGVSWDLDRKFFRFQIFLTLADLHSCKGLKKVNFQSPNLETFWYHEKKSTPCKIDLPTFNTLKSLTIANSKLKGELFQNHLCYFPVLEKLVLSKCNALKKVTISSYQLKALLKEADIGTLNLLLFEYKGDKMHFSSLNPSSLEETKLHFKPSKQEAKSGFCNEDDHTPWFARLQEFLEKSDYSNGLKLVGRSNKCYYPHETSIFTNLRYSARHCLSRIVIYEKPKEIFLPPVYHLKLVVVKSSTALEDLLDDILRTWRPETLSSLSISRSNLPKSLLVRKKLMAREKELSCCTYNVSETPMRTLRALNLLGIYSDDWDGGKDQPSGKKKMSLVIGPWGGTGGAAWDDGTYHGVREITLVYDRCIDSIRVIYDKNGKPVTAEKHGGMGGNKTAEIKLNFPEEFLISVSGHYCPVVHGGGHVIRSLTFKSNQRTFGPYGVEEGTPFTFSMEGGRIAGFNGRSGWYLDSIGFRLSRVQSPKLFQKVQKGFQRLASSVSKSPAKNNN